MSYPGKRLMDLALAGPALVLSLPLQAVTALAIRVTMGSPALFRQQRPGLHGEPFEMLKFRTMHLPDPARGLVTDAQRMTRTGAFLRSTSLDELPTLWNIVKGDMSVVGPRPLLMQYLDRYTPEQARRHEVRPGLTGLAQVSGRNALSWEDKFDLDVEYVGRYSLVGDLRIIAKTIVQVLRRDGISAPGNATMPEFFGALDSDKATPRAAAPDEQLTEPKRLTLSVTASISWIHHSGFPQLLSKHGWEVHLLSSPGQELSLFEASGLHTHPTPIQRDPSFRDLSTIVQLVHIYHRIAPTIAMYGTPKAALLGAIATTIIRVPRRIYVLHGLRADGATGVPRRILLAIECLTCTLSTEVIAVSPSLKEEAVRLRLVPKRKIYTIGAGSINGIEIPERIQPRTPNDFDLPTIGYLGRLNRDKGIPLLIDALQEIHATGRRFKLLLVGPIEDEISRQIVESLPTLSFEAHWVDHVTNPGAYLQKFDILCLPSYREGLGVAVLEAASYCIPAVVSDITGLRDTVRHGETGYLFNPGDPQDLAAMISHLLDSPNSLREMGASARTRVEEEFARNNVQDELLKKLAKSHIC